VEQQEEASRQQHLMPLLVPASAHPGDIIWGGITVISFTNQGMLDFALNWLWHLRRTLGEAQVAASLLLFVVGQGARSRLLESGLVPEGCLRYRRILPSSLARTMVLQLVCRGDVICGSRCSDCAHFAALAHQPFRLLFLRPCFRDGAVGLSEELHEEIASGVRQRLAPLTAL
jgi:hypothetical protein